MTVNELIDQLNNAVKMQMGDEEIRISSDRGELEIELVEYDFASQSLFILAK